MFFYSIIGQIDRVQCGSNFTNLLKAGAAEGRRLLDDDGIAGMAVTVLVQLQFSREFRLQLDRH